MKQMCADESKLTFPDFSGPHDDHAHPPIKCVPQQEERILFAKVTHFLNFAVPTLPISLSPPPQTLSTRSHVGWSKAILISAETDYMMETR